MLRQSCPKGEDRGAWESDCNAIADFIIAHPHDTPGEETVAVFERLLDILNNSLSTGRDEDQHKVKQYNNLKDDLIKWKDWGFAVGEGRDSLVYLEHMNDVRNSVSTMTNARIRIDDVLTLMQDSFISLTKVGFGVSHAEELRSNLNEYSYKLMAYADTVSRGNDAGVALIQSEAQESLSKTIHSFFPAMEFLAEQEKRYEDNPSGFTLDQARQVADMGDTMLNAYEAIFDIGSNAFKLGSFNPSWVSPLHQSIDMTQSAFDLSGVKVSGRNYHEAARDKESDKIKMYDTMCNMKPSNPIEETQVINALMQRSKARMNYFVEEHAGQHITKLFNCTRSLTKELVDAKSNTKFDSGVGRSIERLFSEHVLSPVGSFQLNSLFSKSKKASEFEQNFGKLHDAMIQSIMNIQLYKLNVKSTQARVNVEAEQYINTYSKNKVSVVASHDIRGKMSRILMKKSQKEEPRWYDVILSEEELTFAPTGGTRSKSDLTVPVSNENETVRFPMV
jgi:hypothetical protein